MQIENGKIDHEWGMEIIWASTEQYCGKILVFKNRGSKTPLQFHKEKTKSWFVNHGKLKVSYVDTSTGEKISSEITEGMTFQVNSLAPYEAEALESDTMVFEVGSAELENDGFIVNAC